MSTAPVVTVGPHPLLDAACFVTTFERPLGELASPAEVLACFAPGASAPLASDEPVKAAIRALLRHGGFRPAGRAKPASEYLTKAVEGGWLSPDQAINLAVDTGNAVSLHSGLPISVLDADQAAPDWRIRLAEPGEAYAFNPTGQVIELAGLLVICDAEGPCGSPVKDSQRTKTHAGTTTTLTVIWGTDALPGRTQAALTWYLELLAAAAARTRLLALSA